MKVSLSLMSFDGDIDQKIYKACNSPHDIIHIDYMDDFDLIYVLQELQSKNKQADLHIVSSNVIKCLQDLRSKSLLDKLNYVFVQIENLDDESLSQLKTFNEVDIAIQVSSDWENYKDFILSSSTILIMTSTPGKSGGVFHTDTYNKVLLAQNINPKARLYVDGGITADNCDNLKEMNVHTLVIGSFLAKADDINLRYTKLKNNKNLQVLLVALSEPIKNLPFVENTDLVSVLTEMKKHSSNYVLVKREDVLGIITDGDLKRHLIDNDVSLVNYNLFHMKETDTLEDLFSNKCFRFELGCIPLLNDKGQIKNALHVNAIIRK